MGHPWDKEIAEFIRQCTRYEVRMLMVGGGAVNFHGYQRHSADVDFWIERSSENLLQLSKALEALGFEKPNFPPEVLDGERNISLKFSPESLHIELITRFLSALPFDQAYEEAEKVEYYAGTLMRWRVISFDHLIESKLKSGRPKDLLDVQELLRRRADRDHGA